MSKEPKNVLSTNYSENVGWGVLNNKKTGRQKKILIITGIIFCICLTIGVSYAWWTSSASQLTENVIGSDCLRLEITDETGAIKLEKSYPITDTEADMLTPYTFSVKNTCGTNINYDVELDIMETSSPLRSEYIAVSFDGAPKKMLSTVTSVTPSYNKSDYRAVEGRRLASGSLPANETKSYTIKLWMDEHVTVEDDAMNKQFISKIVVNASLSQIGYQERILNGAHPVLADNLIPVVIDEEGNVTKANTNSKWYSYEEKKWANAVILNDSSKIYKNGEVIPESSIESYFVWIPKYKYKLWNIGDTPGSSREIEIVFGTENTKDATSGECTTPKLSGESGSCDVGDYMTHPAFLAFGTNGLWVGKFETGYKGATSIDEAQVNTSDSSKIQIKPNVYSWRNINISTMYTTSYNYNRDLDSHMMKNTEWGSVAYLTNSKYGRCENGTCTEITINSNSSYITGMTNSTGYFSGSVLASTTGNYTGVYDMSGGANEYVMGVTKDSNGNPLSGSSGFTVFPDAKYMDVYNYNESPSNYEGRLLGDATTETKEWNGDYAKLVYVNNPWILRGGSWGNISFTGSFSFLSDSGTAFFDVGFRVVCAG